MVITVEFKFDPELPKDWNLSFDEIYPFLKDLPVDEKYGREEMEESYKNGIPTKDLTCYNSHSQEEPWVRADVSGDKNRLIWAKWRLAVAEAIANKYASVLCGIQFDGKNFKMRDLFQEGE